MGSLVDLIFGVTAFALGDTTLLPLEEPEKPSPEPRKKKREREENDA